MIQGRGTIELVLMCKEHDYILLLENVLHVPGMWNNLILLGCSDAAGGYYTGGGGTITLIMKDGRHVPQETKINNHLYKMKMAVKAPTFHPLQTFIGCELAHTWETWHWQFGNVGYSGLQKLLEKRLVDEFNMDEQTPKPDCVTCTEVKQHVKPFPKTVNQSTEPRELTHINLWGSNLLTAINTTYYSWMMQNTK